MEGVTCQRSHSLIHSNLTEQLYIIPMSKDLLTDTATTTGTPASKPTLKPALWAAIRKGLKSRCPDCGKGKLYRAYLKPVATCSECGHEWENVRADDGPAWATMLIVGHLIGPIAVAMILNPVMPLWASLIVLPLITFAMCLTLLPAIKGAFMAILWITDAPTS